jgi:dynein heavy chain 1
MQSDHVYERLADDLTKWQRLLQSVRKSRTTFDTSEREKQFGPIVVSYELVQAKVNLKYDSWHKDILARFGQKLGGSMAEFHGSVSNARSELERQSIEGASTSEAVNFITYVQSLKRKTKFWEKQVEVKLLFLVMISS